MYTTQLFCVFIFKSTLLDTLVSFPICRWSVSILQGFVLSPLEVVSLRKAQFILLLQNFLAQSPVWILDLNQWTYQTLRGLFFYDLPPKRQVFSLNPSTGFWALSSLGNRLELCRKLFDKPAPNWDCFLTRQASWRNEICQHRKFLFIGRWLEDSFWETTWDDTFG